MICIGVCRHSESTTYGQTAQAGTAVEHIAHIRSL